MENKLRGTVELIVGEERLTFCYTWDALIKSYDEWGDGDIDLKNPSVLIRFAHLGLGEFHPDLTLEQFKAMRAPMLPLANAARRAYTLAYVGFDEGEMATADPREPGRLRSLIERIWQPSGRASEPESSLH
jgi:hypothetical protein